MFDLARMELRKDLLGAKFFITLVLKAVVLTVKRSTGYSARKNSKIRKMKG
jgi:hypothetical protein